MRRDFAVVEGDVLERFLKIFRVTADGVDRQVHGRHCRRLRVRQIGRT
jgi:hypothetical protein